MRILVETDSRSRVVLPANPDRRFLMHENGDGSILLEPARVVGGAQLEYKQDEALRKLLSRAAQSTSVRRERARRS